MENLQTLSFVSRLFHIFVLVINFSQLTASSTSGTGRDLTEGSSYFFYQHSEHPRDCQEILSQCSASNSFTSGVYLIKPDGYPQPFEVFCDNSIESEGWTVVQRRVDGSVDFKRSWTEYKEGFGFLSSEFWLGNEKVSFLTNQKTYEVRIDMVNEAGSSFFVHYDQFRISDDWGNFKLGRFGEYTGNASNVAIFCPVNMEYDHCSCQDKCSGGCQRNCVDGEETCICPNGFFLDQNSNCVSEQECSCYIEEFGLIPEGESRVSSDCSRTCSCNNNQRSCITLQCSSDATCQEIAGAHQCQCNEGFEGDGLDCRRPTTVPPAIIMDCLDLYNAGHTADGVYTINPSGLPGSDFQVYCDMTTDRGGWTVFQRRQDGSQSFYNNWATYKVGFGSLSGEHWLGNDKIHAITTSKTYQLRVDLVDSRGSSYHALYSRFSISDESDKYRLSLSYSSGTAGDAMNLSVDEAFSTYDRDNDQSSTYNCAEKHKGGWWHYDDYYYYYNYCYNWPAGSYYRYCTNSNLNGDYSGGNGQNVFWWNLPSGRECNVRQTEMKIRPI
ncbi:Fibrinogen C domain-containing protein 1 [Holothuria leucospilota]|uniref:Fibrinogen C domain-containing protein 1 n=1 Tax=Holothuria leucospilota TaxID=206669 RepID=A0A9Q1CMM1_HOLLE|nr:Fibrinogen C domain-containing protein 1 [Holothuria leucospilota]